MLGGRCRLRLHRARRCISHHDDRAERAQTADSHEPIPINNQRQSSDGLAADAADKQIWLDQDLGGGASGGGLNAIRLHVRPAGTG